MYESFDNLKIELIIITLIKSLIVYLITLLSLHDLKFFELQNAFLNLLVLILTPTMLLQIIKDKEISFSFKYFVLFGVFISLISSFIRIVILNKFLTEILYNYILSDKKWQVFDNMTLTERSQEIIKFTLIGILFFLFIGIIKKVIQRIQINTKN